MNHYIEVVSCDVSYNLAPEARPADLDPLLNNKHKNTREGGDIGLFITLVRFLIQGLNNYGDYC